MPTILNLGINGSTTKDWLKVSEGMTLTAYDPSLQRNPEPELIEPGRAVNLPARDRARMNRVNPGVHNPPERL